MSATGILTRFFVTHVRIITSGKSTAGFPTASSLPERSPTELTLAGALLQFRHRAYSRSFSARGLSTSQLLRNV